MMLWQLNGFRGTPGRKKHTLLWDKYFREDSRIHYFRWKSLNMCWEWENINECNKYLLYSQYPWWQVNGEPLNTFGTLELLFPISKKKFVLILFQFPKTVLLNFLLRCCRRLWVGQTCCPLYDEFIDKPLRGSTWTNENDSMRCAKDYYE